MTHKPARTWEKMQEEKAASALRRALGGVIRRFSWASPSTRRELQRQDVLGNIAKELYDTDSVTDDFALRALENIQRMPTYEQRKDAYEVLSTVVINGHPYGVASDVYEKIQKSWNTDSWDYCKDKLE